MEGLLSAYLREREYLPAAVVDKLPLGAIVAAVQDSAPSSGDPRKHAINVLRLCKDAALAYVKSHHYDLYTPLPPPESSGDMGLPDTSQLYETVVKERGVVVVNAAGSPVDANEVTNYTEDRTTKRETYEARLAQLLASRGDEQLERSLVDTQISSRGPIDAGALPDCIVLSSHDRDVVVDESPFDFTIEVGNIGDLTVRTPVYKNNPTVPGTRGHTLVPDENDAYDPNLLLGDQVGEEIHHRLGHMLPTSYNVLEVEVRAGDRPLPAYLVLYASGQATMYRKGHLTTYLPMTQAIEVRPPSTLGIRTTNMRLPLSTEVFVGLLHEAAKVHAHAYLQETSPRVKFTRYGCVDARALVDVPEKTRGVVLDADLEVTLLLQKSC